MKHRILIVEDDSELAMMIRQFLMDEGFSADIVDNGPQATEIICSQQPDLVLLDIMLPGENGIDVIRKVRDHYHGRIIMLTAKDDDITEVNALNRGADDFLEKPVRPHILLAHIKAQLRRQGEEVQCGAVSEQNELVVDRGKREAYLNASLLELTTAEFDLLNYFQLHAGEVVSRDELYEQLRNIEYDGVDRAMDMRISALRRKMDDDTPPYRYIKTVRGKGYMLPKD